MSRNDEWTPTETDDGLLAQVIPLRRRTAEPDAPQILADEPRGGFPEPEEFRAHDERSVWEAPAELPRRRPTSPARSARSRIPGGPVRSRLSDWRPVRAIAVAAITLAVAAPLGLAGLGELLQEGQPASSALHASVSGSSVAQDPTQSPSRIQRGTHHSAHPTQRAFSSASARTDKPRRGRAAVSVKHAASESGSATSPTTATQVVVASVPSASTASARANAEFTFER